MVDETSSHPNMVNATENILSILNRLSMENEISSKK